MTLEQLAGRTIESAHFEEDEGITLVLKDGARLFFKTDELRIDDSVVDT